MVWLPAGEKITKISLFVSTECTNVTDGRTSHDDAIASRGNKIVCYLQIIFNRNRKLKQVCKLSALKLGIYLNTKACYVFVCIFLQMCQNSNF